MRRVSYEAPRAYEFALVGNAVDGKRMFYSPSQIVLTDSRKVLGSCVGCVEAPCLSFNQAELAQPAVIDSGFSPDTAVCPTGAIRQGESRVPIVDRSHCIGCGVCVLRCPFGAISLNPDDGTARVTPPAEPDFIELGVDNQTTEDSTNARIKRVLRSDAPEDANGDISRQFLRFADVLPLVADPQRTMRLLARNSFLVADLPARLRIAGDSNSWVDMISSVGNQVLIVEIEPGPDTLDAVRRVLSGAAIAMNRYHLDANSILGAVVFPRLPNNRVEFYRVLQDIKNRIGLSIVPLPIALMQLTTRCGGTPLRVYLDSYASSGTSLSVSSIALELFGDFGDPVVVGLEPPK